MTIAKTAGRRTPTPSIKNTHAEHQEHLAELAGRWQGALNM
jgi:hypothetical protein